MEKLPAPLRLLIQHLIPAVFCCICAFACPAQQAAPAAPGANQTLGIILSDRTALRATASPSAQQQAVLWAGELVEIRGEKLDYLQIYTHQRERGGFVAAAQVKRLILTTDNAPELFAAQRYLRELYGQEGLTIGLIAAWLKSAPSETLTTEAAAEVFLTLGEMAQQLADQVSNQTPRTVRTSERLDASLDVARQYGLRFYSIDDNDTIRLCYDGDAFRRALALPATAEQKARAALALTRPDCIDPALPQVLLRQYGHWQAEVLGQVDTATLPPWIANRIHLRRAAIWSQLAWQEAISAGVQNNKIQISAAISNALSIQAATELPQALLRQQYGHWQTEILGQENTTTMPPWIAPQRAAVWSQLARQEAMSAGAQDNKMQTSAIMSDALSALATADRNQLTEKDLPAYNNALMRVNASRWAVFPDNTSPLTTGDKPWLASRINDAGQTCLQILDQKHGPQQPLFERCTFGKVWLNSASRNRTASALAVAVQPTVDWRELWLFHRIGQHWQLHILPPAAATPGLGYAEFAGWTPDGTQMLVAREARAEGRYYPPAYEVIDIASATAVHSHRRASALPLFQRWQDTAWKAHSVSVR